MPLSTLRRIGSSPMAQPAARSVAFRAFAQTHRACLETRACSREMAWKLRYRLFQLPNLPKLRVYDRSPDKRIRPNSGIRPRITGISPVKSIVPRIRIVVNVRRMQPRLAAILPRPFWFRVRSAARPVRSELWCTFQAAAKKSQYRLAVKNSARHAVHRYADFPLRTS